MHGPFVRSVMNEPHVRQFLSMRGHLNDTFALKAENELAMFAHLKTYFIRGFVLEYVIVIPCTNNSDQNKQRFSF